MQIFYRKVQDDAFVLWRADWNEKHKSVMTDSKSFRTIMKVFRQFNIPVAEAKS